MTGKVVVLTNLRPKKLGGKALHFYPSSGFLSFGMIICAHSENNEKIELVRPPQGLTIILTFS